MHNTHTHTQHTYTYTTRTQAHISHTYMHIVHTSAFSLPDATVFRALRAVLLTSSDSSSAMISSEPDLCIK